MSELLNWPRPFDPDRAPVFVHNELVTDSSIGDLWRVLIHASTWPDWYPHASDVQNVPGDGDLALGTAFSWRTLGVRVATTVTEFTPNQALAWSGTARGSRGYHRWLFEPAVDGTCRIVTEEVQAGPVPMLMATRLRRELQGFHQEWLEGLADRAGSERMRRTRSTGAMGAHGFAAPRQLDPPYRSQRKVTRDDADLLQGHGDS